jgi:hypothetical protein
MNLPCIPRISYPTEDFMWCDAYLRPSVASSTFESYFAILKCLVNLGIDVLIDFSRFAYPATCNIRISSRYPMNAQDGLLLVGCTNLDLNILSYPQYGQLGSNGISSDYSLLHQGNYSRSSVTWQTLVYKYEEGQYIGQWDSVCNHHQGLLRRFPESGWVEDVGS